MRRGEHVPPVEVRAEMETWGRPDRESRGRPRYRGRETVELDPLGREVVPEAGSGAFPTGGRAARRSGDPFGGQYDDTEAAGRSGGVGRTLGVRAATSAQPNRRSRRCASRRAASVGSGRPRPRRYIERTRPTSRSISPGRTTASVGMRWPFAEDNPGSNPS